MPEIAFYKDHFIEVDEPVIPIQERGHQFGDGIYEVIRVYGGQPFTMEEHLARLEVSLAAIRMPLPYPLKEIERLSLEALEKSGLKEAEIYMQVTRGIHARQHQFPVPQEPILSIIVKDARTVTEEKRTAGVPVVTVEDVRWKLCYVKSLNLLPNVMAKQEAYEAGAHEAIFVEKGMVKEGSSTNIFCVKDGVLQTHPATNGILHGITRQVVLDLAAELGIPTEERTFSLPELKDAEEVFITSTTMEVLKVSSIDGEALSSDRTVLDQLYEAFQQRKKQLVN